MSLEGDLGNLGLPKVLQSLAAQAASGILTVQGEEDIVAVSLLDGGIVAADALNQTVEEGLGEVLQEQNLITREDFAAAVSDHQGGGSGSLGDMLVTRGLVSRADLLEGLRTQTFQLMLQILTWRQGEFKFYGGDEVSYEDGFLPISVEELLIRSIDELGEKGGIAGPIPDLESAYRRVPQRTAPQILGRDGDGMGGGIWISAQQEAFMTKVSNQISAAAVATQLDLNRYQALFALYNLLHHDLIEHVGPPKADLANLDLDIAEEPSEPDEPLRAEIFTPPEPGDPSASMVSAAPASGLLQRWTGPVLAVLLTLALAAAIVPRAGTLLLPFPWQETQRAAFERQLRQSLYLKLDRAAKTFFLIEVQYPSTIEELARQSLISESDLMDPAGGQLTYSTDDFSSYRIVPVIDGRRAQELSATEAITGDFFLDPQFLRPPSTDVPPLYLKD